VTGANRGIGLELCRQLAERGWRVIAACRKRSKELDALDVTVVTGIDVADDPSVARLAARLRDEPVDLLINNAGILSEETLDDLDFARMRTEFEVNALGPLRVTKALLPNLRSGSRVAIISSRVGSIGDNASGGVYGYRMSKAAVNMAGVNLAHDLRSRGVAVFLLHPGLVATEMTDRRGIPPSQSAAMLIERLDELGLGESGMFFHANGEQLPW
jgi:NAD(P)-dependent dehydrogenase (short-subunit alcohol dehydrogenase family)